MPLAEVHVTLKPALFDAQGETIKKALHQLNHTQVQNVRIGKYITLEIDGVDDAALQSQLDLMCQQLLANPVIEDYEITLPGSTAPVSNNGAAAVAVTGTRVVESTGTGAASSPSTETVSTPGGFTDPFNVDFRSYEAMPTDAKLALRSLALRKYSSWIEGQLKAHNAAWILCLGQEVIESGTSMSTYPSDQALLKHGIERELVPWVFTKPN
jgi:phosphoribosylformylglycinamidine synthase PurS subunit